MKYNSSDNIPNSIPKDISKDIPKGVSMDIPNDLPDDIKSNPNLLSAYKHCLKIATSHYENFPVASFFLPKKIRYPVAAIYAFARTADDYSDEGNLTKEERFKYLDDYWEKLVLIQNGKIPNNKISDDKISNNKISNDKISNDKISNDKIFFALFHTITVFKLPIQLFFDLLIAFKQDVTKTTYSTFSEVLEYCKHSANPVGRLLLYLTNNATPANLALSDNICTSLQLINFLQDLYSDAKERNRCYMPRDEMESFGFEFSNILNKKENKKFSQFIDIQIQRAEKIMKDGAPLGSKLTGLFGFKIRAIIAAGKLVIKDLYKRKSIYDRPVINFFKLPIIFLKALINL